MNLRTFGHSDIGRMRSENEDSFLCDNKRRLYAVADGIGGLPAGAQASQLAISTLDSIFSRPARGGRDYPSYLEEINNAVFSLGRSISERLGIGTTLVFGHIVDETMHVMHVGDSILLRFRNGEVDQLTTDHNLENEARQRIARGEPVGLIFENRQALTRCIGQPPPLEGDYMKIGLRAGDRYLFCSDGITRMMTLVDISERLAASKEPEAWVRALIDRANERGGYDNATAVAVYVD